MKYRQIPTPAGWGEHGGSEMSYSVANCKRESAEYLAAEPLPTARLNEARHAAPTRRLANADFQERAALAERTLGPGPSNGRMKRKKAPCHGRHAYQYADGSPETRRLDYWTASQQG